MTIVKEKISWNYVKERYMEFHKIDIFTENMAIDVDFGYYLVNNLKKTMATSPLIEFHKKVIKTFENMNTYHDSEGNRYSQLKIDNLIIKAKKIKISLFIDEHGYIFCEDCKRSDVFPIDCSHDISVDKCKKTGRLEKAWDVDNITLRCRGCHQKHDKLYIEPNKIKS